MMMILLGYAIQEIMFMLRLADTLSLGDVKLSTPKSNLQNNHCQVTMLSYPITD
jgi:hypothetical protein